MRKKNKVVYLKDYLDPEPVRKARVKLYPEVRQPDLPDFEARQERIRTSLAKINTLMAELKRQAEPKDVFCDGCAGCFVPCGRTKG